MTENEIKKLVDMAIEAQKYSYAPYSNHNVGAALLARDGAITTGCNIENAAFGPTCCAERVAFFKAISSNKRGTDGSSFTAIAVVGGKNMTHDNYCPPCGVCRQVMREFCNDDFIIITTDGDGHYKTTTLGELLPQSFGPEFVRGGERD